MSNERVVYTIEEGIAWVKLNRPEKHNAIDMAMFIGIDKTIRELAKNRSVRVVIVSGEGPSFCSGLDVKSVLTNKSNALKLLWKWLPGNPNLAQRVAIGWRRLKVPVIMALHGNCWGGGMQIALGGDFRIASPDCSLAIMEAKWGLIPDMGGTPGLMENVSADHAMKLAMTAVPIQAAEAKQIGLITELSEDPLKAAAGLAEQLKDRSPDTNRIVKSLYQKVWSRGDRRIIAGETLNQIKILMGKNQPIATKRSLGHKDIQYRL